MQLTSHNVDQTLALGRLLGQFAPLNTCLALHGQLGAGKTHLTRGIAEGAKVADPSLVSSPTYVLLQLYSGPKPVFHIDAYRITSEEDFETVGLDELLAGDREGGITVIEWPEKIPHLLPADTLHVHIEPMDRETERLITLEPAGPNASVLAQLVAGSWGSR